VTSGPIPDDSGTSIRVRALNDEAERPAGDFVLYWMVAHRRLSWNFALDRAVGHARRLRKPLVILEAIRAGYDWASDRHHAFALDGMREHRDRLRGSRVGYHPYLEPRPGAGKGLVCALAERACVVVTDDFPAFFLPRMIRAAASRVRVRVEAVDANGLLPLAATPGPFSAAVHFRRFLQKNLGDHLLTVPDADPLDRSLPAAAALPAEISERWPAATDPILSRSTEALAGLPIDHSVPPTDARGGAAAGRSRLRSFLDRGLASYAADRNHPDAEATSGLSPYLHWGHLSAHEVFDAVARREGWSPARLSTQANGKRRGWWGMGEGAEAFLDQLVTWRELCFGFCVHVPEYDRYETLPEWARETLEDHAADPREATYSLDDLDRGCTHDPLWNAAQAQLRTEGVIHNYLRMLWGKKILEWSPHPREALAHMIELNNRYALDGRDPNSYGGIFWILGRFDRGWPTRPVFGKVRSMSSSATRKKVEVARYLDRWGGQGELGLD
jgi:deoxyribodipyrimidine photo-lyase